MNLYRLYTDQELTGLLKSGDHAAFTEIYHRYWPLLFAHARHMLRNNDAPMDIVQEIFTNLWNRSADLQLEISLKAYLYGATRNLTLTQIQKGKRKDHYLSSLVKQFEKGSPVTDEQVICNEFVERMEKELANLPPKMRAVFELSRKEGLSHKEIAEEMDLSDHAVKKTIHRALKVLRTQLSALLFLTW